MAEKSTKSISIPTETFLEIAGIMYVALDRNGRITLVNKKTCEVLNYSEEDLLGKLWFETILPENERLEVTEYFNKLMLNKVEPVEYHENTVLTSIGEERTIGWHNVLLKDDSGRITGALSAGEDITDRKLTERQLSFTQFTVDQAKMAVFWCHSDGMFFYINQTALDWLQYSMEEILSMHLADINPELPREGWAAHWNEIKEKGAVRRESFHRRKNGEIYPVEIYSNYVQFDAKEYKLDFVNDITERKKIEESRKLEEEKYKLLIESQTGLTVKVDPEGHFLFISPSYCKLFGKKEEDLLGTTFMPMIHEEDRELTIEGMKALYQPPYECYLEQRALTAKGWRWLAWADKSILDKNGRVIAIVGAGLDITRQKEAEEERNELQKKLRQAEKLEAIGQLAGGIAHDFNNQLGGIAACTEVVKARLPGDPKLIQYADNILFSVKKAANLTRELLAFAHKGKYISLTVDINLIVKEALSLLERSLNKNIVIKTSLKASPATTQGDPSQLQNAILNIAINARDAMPEGGELTIDTANIILDEDYCKKNPYIIEAGRYLRVNITDNGTGIPDDILPHIFEPFFTTRRSQGTGMGLAAVYGIVKTHKGALNVYSGKECGTTFSIYLPELEEAGAQIDLSLPEKTVRGSGKILLVDDESLIANAAAEILSELGYTVTECSNGMEALEVYRKDWLEIDCVILDMIMPKMGGKETFVEMQKINPKIAALLSSGYSINGEAQSILDLGVKDFLQKPFSRQELSVRLARVLEQRSS